MNPLRRRTSERAMKLPPIYDKDSNWYMDWYFDLRLEEEMARAARYQLPLSVVVLLRTEPTDSKQDGALLRELLSDIAVRKLRRSDIPAILAGRKFAVLLPHTNAGQADVVAKRLTKWFAPFSVATGIASFPEESEESSLLETAEGRAMKELGNDGSTCGDEERLQRQTNRNVNRRFVGQFME